MVLSVEKSSEFFKSLYESHHNVWCTSFQEPPIESHQSRHTTFSGACAVLLTLRRINNQIMFRGSIQVVYVTASSVVDQHVEAVQGYRLLFKASNLQLLRAPLPLVRNLLDPAPCSYLLNGYRKSTRHRR
jgi:hypothetical protein